MEFDAGNNDSGEYMVKAIWDSAVLTRESISGLLLGIYYLVLCKRYLKEENIWESALADQHLRKFISSFRKDYLDKPTATFLAIDTTSPMTRLPVKPNKSSKQK